MTPGRVTSLAGGRGRARAAPGWQSPMDSGGAPEAGRRLMQEPTHPSRCPGLSARLSQPPRLQTGERVPRLSSAAFINKKAYFKQYSATSPSCLLEGVDMDRHAPGAFPGTGRGPRPRGVPGRGQAGRIVMTPCTRPSRPWKPLESTRGADGPPLPELDEQPVVSNPKD